MNIWDTLGIDQTDNISVIKKAYSKKLKTNHPEDNPTGFQILKEAYDIATQYAKAKQYQDEHSDFNIDNSDSLYSQVDYTESSNSYDFEFGNKQSLNLFKSEQENKLEIEISNFIEQLNQLYSDVPQRINIDNWINLLNHDLMWNIENRSYIEFKILEYLSTHYYLPQDVWRFLDTTFNVSERTEELESDFGVVFVKHYMKVIYQSFPINYSYIPQGDWVDYDKYVETKEIIQERILTKDTRDAEKYIKEAKEQSQNDPELIRMEAVIYFTFKKYDYALTLLNQAISLNANDFEGLYYRASIYTTKKNYTLAEEDLQKILIAKPYEANSVLLSLQCNLKLNNISKSFELMDLSYKLRQQLESYAKLDKLKKRLASKLWLNIFIKPLSLSQNVKQLLRFYNINRTTFTLKNINKFLLKSGKMLLKILIFLICLGAAVVTKIGVIFLVLYFIQRKDKNNQ